MFFTRSLSVKKIDEIYLCWLIWFDKKEKSDCLFSYRGFHVTYVRWYLKTVSQTSISVSQTSISVSQTSISVSQTRISISQTSISVSQTSISISQTIISISQAWRNIGYSGEKKMICDRSWSYQMHRTDQITKVAPYMRTYFWDTI